MSMDIYAPSGTKVVYAYPDSGYAIQQKLAALHLAAGAVYTVEKTSVGRNSTKVYLVEFPRCQF